MYGHEVSGVSSKGSNVEHSAQLAIQQPVSSTVKQHEKVSRNIEADCLFGLETFRVKICNFYEFGCLV